MLAAKCFSCRWRTIKISDATARHVAKLHPIDLNSLPDESLHHTLQHLHHLLNQRQPLFKAYPLPFYRLKLSCQSVGMHPSEMMPSMRSHTSAGPASITDLSISATIPDGPAASPEDVLLSGVISKVIGSLGP